MDQINGAPGKEDELLKELEMAVRRIVKSNKSSRADKLSAINAGTKLLAIRHRILGGDVEKGFFDR
jgi:hypothetical protein